jgi:hypothetical protein
MTTCCGARLSPGLTHCSFCRRTIGLIQGERCVTCTEPVVPEYAERVEGQCRACRDRRVRMSRATARLLKLAAAARHMRKKRAA